MTDNDDGGPAFPSIDEIFEHLSSRSAPIYRMESKGGISLRDWFAGMALQGIIAHYGTGGRYDDHAENAFCEADAMLKVRKK